MNASALLKEKGFRITPQRLAVFEAVLGNKTHPSAESVYTAVREKFPSISLNTVYKTLQSFQEAGLLWQLNIARNLRYDGNTLPHAHLCCLRCGQVDDLNGGLAKLFTDLADLGMTKSGFKIDSLEVNFYGSCPSCSRHAVNLGPSGPGDNRLPE
jgi:Fur family peroxide stress response transcriptional regulator